MAEEVEERLRSGETCGRFPLTVAPACQMSTILLPQPVEELVGHVNVRMLELGQCVFLPHAVRKHVRTYTYVHDTRIRAHELHATHLFAVPSSVCTCGLSANSNSTHTGHASLSSSTSSRHTHICANRVHNTSGPTRRGVTHRSFEESCGGPHQGAPHRAQPA